MSPALLNISQHICVTITSYHKIVMVSELQIQLLSSYWKFIMFNNWMVRWGKCCWVDHDRVCHGELLRKLYEKGIRGWTLNCLGFMVSCLLAEIVLGWLGLFMSASIDVTTGAPNGSFMVLFSPWYAQILWSTMWTMNKRCLQILSNCILFFFFALFLNFTPLCARSISINWWMLVGRWVYKWFLLYVLLCVFVLGTFTCH